MNMYLIGKYIFIFLCALYVLSALSQIETIGLILSGLLPFTASAQLAAKLPFLLLTHAATAERTLFLLNVILSATYTFLITERLRQVRKKHIAYGLSGSFLTIFSVGCVACGALLSPLALAASLGVPLMLIGHAEILFGVTANILLAMGVLLLMRDHVVIPRRNDRLLPK